MSVFCSQLVLVASIGRISGLNIKLDKKSLSARLKLNYMIFHVCCISFAKSGVTAIYVRQKDSAKK